MSIIFPIAGARFRPNEAKMALLSLSIGDRVSLVPEPANNFDENAIQIFTAPPLPEAGEPPAEAHFIGYVPKSHNQQVAALSVGAGLFVWQLFAATYALNGLYTEFVVAADENELDQWLDHSRSNSAPSAA